MVTRNDPKPRGSTATWAARVDATRAARRDPPGTRKEAKESVEHPCFSLSGFPSGGFRSSLPGTSDLPSEGFCIPSGGPTSVDSLLSQNSRPAGFASAHGFFGPAPDPHQVPRIKTLPPTEGGLGSPRGPQESRKGPRKGGRKQTLFAPTTCCPRGGRIYVFFFFVFFDFFFSCLPFSSPYHGS